MRRSLWLTRRDASRSLMLAALLGACGMAHSEGARWLPWPARRGRPGMHLPDLDGSMWDMQQEAGTPLLLNFWASWCEPCRAEMQSFAQLLEQRQDKPLKVIAVNYKESLQSVQHFRQANALPFTWVRDSYGDVSHAWGVHVFPTTVLINRAGRAVQVVEGEVDWASPSVQKRLAAWV